MRLPLAIGAVVLGVPSTFQTPLSGQISPVRALVPIGARFAAVVFILYLSRSQVALLRHATTGPAAGGLPEGMALHLPS